MEEWRSIPGYEPYEISNLGRLRNELGDIMKTSINWQGYHRTYFCSLKKNAKIHRLVAYAFLPTVSGKTRVNHKNCIKTDNRADNLEWCTDKENRKHANDNGLLYPARGDSLPQTKLDEVQVRTIKKCLSDGLRQYHLAKYFKVNIATIGDIKYNRSWAWVI